MSVPENIVRLRRLRRTPTLRQLMREHAFSLDDLIMPVFVEENISERVAIESMPGIYRYPETQLADYVRSLWHKGIKAILLFGISHHKDKEGSD
ncbi:MAG TPA: porphobilinogen synthase, partial [Cellvibrio sp.]